MIQDVMSNLMEKGLWQGYGDGEAIEPFPRIPVLVYFHANPGKAGKVEALDHVPATTGRNNADARQTVQVIRRDNRQPLANLLFHESPITKPIRKMNFDARQFADDKLRLPLQLNAIDLTRDQLVTLAGL